MKMTCWCTMVGDEGPCNGVDGPRRTIYQFVQSALSDCETVLRGSFMLEAPENSFEVGKAYLFAVSVVPDDQVT